MLPLDAAITHKLSTIRNNNLIVISESGQSEFDAFSRVSSGYYPVETLPRLVPLYLDGELYLILDFQLRNVSTTFSECFELSQTTVDSRIWEVAKSTYNVLATRLRNANFEFSKLESSVSSENFSVTHRTVYLIY